MNHTFHYKANQIPYTLHCQRMSTIQKADTDIHSISSYPCSESYDCTSILLTQHKVSNQIKYSITIQSTSLPNQYFPRNPTPKIANPAIHTLLKVLPKNPQNEKKKKPSSHTFRSIRPQLHMSNKQLSNTKRHIFNLTDISNLISYD